MRHYGARRDIWLVPTGRVRILAAVHLPEELDWTLGQVVGEMSTYGMCKRRRHGVPNLPSDGCG